MNNTGKYIILGLLAMFLIAPTSCKSTKKKSKKGYSKKCGSCPAWGYDFQKNHHFIFVDEKKV